MDLLAGLFELLALWLLGRKQKIGFLLGAVCNVLWMVYVLSTGHTYGLLLVVVPAFAINLKNFNKWRSDETNKKH